MSDGNIQPAYFVHYKGWKQSWDEWVPETRMQKLNQENRAKAKALREAIISKNKEASQSNTSSSNTSNKRRDRSSNAHETSRKRGRDTEDIANEVHKKPEIRLTIPDILKVSLVDDWEYITKNNQLVPLPRKPSIHTILQGYKQHMVEIMNENDEGKKNRNIAVLDEIINGLEMYFNRAISSNLLYRFERPQFVQIKKEADNRNDNDELKLMSHIYGVEHLLRLIVNLPSMLAFTSIDGESVKILQNQIQNILQWLIDNKQVLFLKDYENSSPQYQNLVNQGA